MLNTNAKVKKEIGSLYKHKKESRFALLFAFLVDALEGIGRPTLVFFPFHGLVYLYINKQARPPIKM